MTPNMAVDLALFSRWTLRVNAAKAAHFYVEHGYLCTTTSPLLFGIRNLFSRKSYNNVLTNTWNFYANRSSHIW